MFSEAEGAPEARAKKPNALTKSPARGNANGDSVAALRSIQIDTIRRFAHHGRMTCSPERLLELLDAAGLRHWNAPDPAEGCLIAFMGEQATRPTTIVHVRVDADGTVITATVTAFLRVPEHEHLPVLMQAMLHEAYLTNLGQWEMDPSDGEVRVTVQLPLFDAEPTARQVYRIVSGAAQLAERAWPRLLSILETGCDPKLQEGGEDPVRDELRRLQVRMQALLGSKREAPDNN